MRCGKEKVTKTASVLCLSYKANALLWDSAPYQMWYPDDICIQKKKKKKVRDILFSFFFQYRALRKGNRHWSLEFDD